MFGMGMIGGITSSQRKVDDTAQTNIFSGSLFFPST